MRLIYVSPVPWASFEQRPHKFVRWYHARTQDQVLWIEPYPTRLPRLADFSTTPRHANGASPPPDWLQALRPVALPIEPLPGLAGCNRLLWTPILTRMREFSQAATTLLAFGKPSRLALQAQAHLPDCPTLYDAMDDFSNFYTGISRRTMQRTEQVLALRADLMWASSRSLQHQWQDQRAAIDLVPNALDPTLLPAARTRRNDGPTVFGYVGTVSEWFDWPLVAALARARPRDIVRIIGPIHVQPPQPLPENVVLLPPCPHAEALLAMNSFDVGLIPFRQNPLTEGVDPIKYYEYRALGLNVISTCFGEMAHRRGEAGVHLIANIDEVGSIAARAAAQPAPANPDFVFANSWDARFDKTLLLDRIAQIDTSRRNAAHHRETSNAQPAANP